MTNSEQSVPLSPDRYKSITVKSGGWERTFTGARELHVVSATGTYFITMPDESEPSGRKVEWQQRVENGIAEGVEIRAEP